MKRKPSLKATGKCAGKKPEMRFPDRLIAAIRKYSQMYPNNLLVINLKTLGLIYNFKLRRDAQTFRKYLPASVQAIICDNIPPDVIQVGMRSA